MKRLFIFFILIMSMGFFGFNNMYAQDYESMWKKVEKLLDDDKPKSIIEEAEKIYAIAKKEDNFPQMLKAQICITEKKCDLDPELFQPEEYEKLISSIEGDQSLSKEVKAGRLAVLHCLVASAYNKMVDSYVHDFDEETREQFPAKAKQHLLDALSDMETLSRINDSDYNALITQQEDSRLFNHDLLNVVLDYSFRRFRVRNYTASFSFEEHINLLEKAIKVYEANGNRNAATLLRLNILNIRKSTENKAFKLSEEDYIKQIDELHQQTQDIETGADVDLSYANSLYEDKKLAFVRKAQVKWADSKHINAFKNMETAMMASSISIDMPSNILANKPFDVGFNYKSCNSSTIYVREYDGRTKNSTYSEKGKLLNTYKYVKTLDEANQSRKDANLPYSFYVNEQLSLPVGHYIVIAETEGAKSIHEVKITSLRMVSIPLPDTKNMLVTVLDNETGRPVPDASIFCFENWNTDYGKKPKDTFKVNEKGEATIPYFFGNEKNSYYRILAVRDASKYGTPAEDCTSAITASRTHDLRKKTEEPYGQIYTDRSIYRPGQTVYISALLYKQKADNVQVAPDTDLLISIKNPDYKEVFSENKKTNELGSVDYAFTIPTDCKLGNYHIEANLDKSYINCSFRVEEYKRPTFDVKIEKERNTADFKLNSNATITGQAMTFSDAPVQGAKVAYSIEWAEHFKYWRWNQNWRNLLDDETTTLDNGDFVIDFPTSLPDEVYCDSISFRVKVEVTDINGEMQRGEYTFNVANPDYQETPKAAEGPKDEMTVSTEEISETNDAVVTFKAREKDALVYYYIISNNKIDSRGTKVLNGDELKFTVKYKKEWGDGVSVIVYYVRNGHLYTREKTLTYVRPDKMLTLAWSTFRDKLQPGQKEEWTLSVKDHNNRVVSGAELLAVMYDASLDNLYPHSWDLRLSFERNIKNFYINSSNSNEVSDFSLVPDYKILTTYSRLFDFLQEFEHERWYRYRRRVRIRGGAKMCLSLGAVQDESMAASNDFEGAMLCEAVVVKKGEAAEDDMADENGNDAAPSTVKTMRTNLSELAFFLPHVTTDAKGQAHLSFTLPDCLTEWKFMGLVHTKDMDYGTITARATAKKDFMVQPNMPRFLRTGDKAIISAKLINMCEKDVKGSATLRILNAETEAEVYSTKADFNVASNQSASLSFPVTDQLSEGDYICEIIATNGICNDGERNRLPILSTKVDVVENVPFYLTDAGTKDVDLSAIFNQGSATATDKQLSIGYTDNPAIPVFQSLRALQLPKHDNAPCYAASLYSNLVLLDMAPALSDYLVDFDSSKSQQSATKALEKLKKMQLSDGAWSWFEGMSGSYYITLSVAENLNRLQQYFVLHGKKANSDIDNMLKKALKYLDKKELESFKRRKKNKEKELHPYNDDLRYLAIATNPDKEMLDTYLDFMVKDFRNLTIYGRSEGVLILNKYNRPKDANRFLESVKEYTVFKEGFGRYFATDQAYYSWCDYRIPTQLAAMRAIQTSNNPDGNSLPNRDESLLEMQLWLLRQKQTQTWDNPLNALDIADFLLTTNRETSLHKPQVPTLVLDGMSIKPDSTYTVEGAKNMSVTKTSPGVSWGHVRSTFKEEVNNLQAYTSGELTIERKVIRDGNKVTIRHILHADRDMDFVQVKSQHAASLEPLRTLSGYQYMGGRGCYLEVHDSYVSLFFDKFTRGTTTIDMEYYVAREGEYNSGYATIECSYAPEFGAHTAGNVLK